MVQAQRGNAEYVENGRRRDYACLAALEQRESKGPSMVENSDIPMYDTME
jgi:hypothetical protein